MNKREQIIEELDENEEIIFADGFDDAIIGKIYETNVVVYSFTKAMEILQKNMTEEQAVDFLHFNTLSVMGEGMPVWVMDYYG
jgi:aspartyl/asparaginyl-tRNA synthetase